MKLILPIALAFAILALTSGTVFAQGERSAKSISRCLATLKPANVSSEPLRSTIHSTGPESPRLLKRCWRPIHSARWPGGVLRWRRSTIRSSGRSARNKWPTAGPRWRNPRRLAPRRNASAIYRRDRSVLQGR